MISFEGIICNYKIIQNLIFLYNLFYGSIYGYIIKQKTLIIYLNKLFILPVLTIMKYNMWISISSLTDIIAIDHLNKKGTRFEINYVF
jgi:hypothetical protein